jgi:hypothetical protein
MVQVIQQPSVLGPGFQAGMSALGQALQRKR